jgi:hypothetical protein
MILVGRPRKDSTVLYAEICATQDYNYKTPPSNKDTL